MQKPIVLACLLAPLVVSSAASAKTTFFFTNDLTSPTAGSDDNVFAGDAAVQLATPGSATNIALTGTGTGAANNIADVDYVAADGFLYATDSGTNDRILKISASGPFPQTVTTLYTSPVTTSTFSSLQVIGNNVFFTDADTIKRVSTTGGSVTTVVDLDTAVGAATHTARAMAYDHANDVLYFSTVTSDVVYRIKPDGTGLASFASAATLFPTATNPAINGIAIDSATGKIYLADNNTDKVVVANLSGALSPTEVLSFLPLAPATSFVPEDLELFGGRLYLADSGGDQIVSFNTNGTGMQMLVTPDALYANIKGIAVPEPATLALLSLGGLMLGRRRRA